MALHLHLHEALKSTLRTQRITYADIAKKLKLSEATIKRDFSRGTLSLERFGIVCDAYAISMEALTQHLDARAALVGELTNAQEKTIVANPKLWLVAICAFNQWTFDEIVERYALTPTEVTRHLLTLDKMGILELHAENRIRLKLARNFRWLPDGAFIQTFRNALAKEYLSGTFNDAPDTFRLVIGSLAPASVALLRERMLAIADELATLHARDSRVPKALKQNVTLAVVLREWEPDVFGAMRRQ
jgi:DNA-binding transcriptional ArsR family regulator